jgi:hypothetical protein
LKERRDNETALFLNALGKPLTELELRQMWQILTEGLLTLEGLPPAIEQAQQTWCVEMLMRGITPEDLGILTGWSATKLRPYITRAREKIALNQALRLDQKAQ